MEEIIEKLKEWVNKNYDPYACGFTPQRSEGNYYDCFFDGESCGTSYAAYEVGQILGLHGSWMGRIFRMYQWHMWLLLQNINYIKENKTMKLQTQIILDNVDKVKAFVMTVSKYPGDATLVSGRYVVDAKSIMGIFSLALNKPVEFTYEGELTAELAKEVQVYESQEV